MNKLQLAWRGYDGLRWPWLGELLLHCHMRQEKWATSLSWAAKYVDAQRFCVVLLQRRPDGVDKAA